jgi:hypothetical protein
MTNKKAIDPLIVRVKAEFMEMPGLKLTEAQARRLWALDATTCSGLLTALVSTSFLFRTRDGSFMRIERTAPAKAALAAAQARASVA